VWRMVRRVVGALVKLGLGEITADDFPRLLEGKPDPKLDVAAWTAPASGLFLDRVVYPEISKPEATKPDVTKVQERPVIRESREVSGPEERWGHRRPRR
jgi:tRNA U38,U39,U40 pseudouridine synthase TruA